MKKQYISPVSQSHLVALQELLENYHTSEGADPGMSAVIRWDGYKDSDNDFPSPKDVSPWDD